VEQTSMHLADKVAIVEPLLEHGEAGGDGSA
jgi:hypothetical protein